MNERQNNCFIFVKMMILYVQIALNSTVADTHGQK